MGSDTAYPGHAQVCFVMSILLTLDTSVYSIPLVFCDISYLYKQHSKHLSQLS